MKIEEAIVYILAEHNGGMKAEQIASTINNQHLCTRKDGRPISVKQVWWVVQNLPNTFVFAEGRVFLMM